MRVDLATLVEVETLADLWVDLAEEQRKHGSHLNAASNREAIKAVFSQQVVDDLILVARDEEIVGFVNFSIEEGYFDQSVTRGIIQNVYVRPESRDRGIGTALMDTCEAELSDRGADVIALEAMAANDAARRLYKRRGYDEHRIEVEKPVKSDTNSREGG
jgi:ribosomal protein S18 acetylase RimI-like enzyme